MQRITDLVFASPASAASNVDGGINQKNVNDNLQRTLSDTGPVFLPSWEILGPFQLGTRGMRT